MNKKSIKKLGIVGLVLILVVSVVTPSVASLAMSYEQENSILSNNDVEIPVNENIPEPEQRNRNVEATEIVGERTENEVTYDNHDGTYTKQIFQEAVYTEVDGELLPVDSELTEDEQGNLIPAQTEIDAVFLKKMEMGKYKEYGSDREKISFSLIGGVKSEKLSEENLGLEKEFVIEETADFITTTDQVGSNDENEITYKNIFPSTDLRVQTFNKIVKEDIVLRNQNGIPTYIYEIDTRLKPEVLNDGSISFSNSNSEEVYNIPKPIMTDSNIDEKKGEAVQSEELMFRLEKLTARIYRLYLTVDLEWINSKSRVFPIFIDPSVTIRNFKSANVNSFNKNQNKHGAALWNETLKAYTVRVGQYDQTTGNNIAYMQLDASRINQATVTKATLKVYNIWHSYNNLSNRLNVDEARGGWQINTINWNRMPPQIFIDRTNVGRGEWATFDLTSTVRAWASGSRPNNGIRFTTPAQQNHWKQIVAGENRTNVPYLEIIYSYPKAPKPTVKSFSLGSTDRGYLEYNWPRVNGAIGYNLLLSDGKQKITIPVGNVATYSTRGKGLFPTVTDLANGMSTYRRDGKGTDLSLDPRELYENSQGNLVGSTNYNARISVIYPLGTSPASDRVSSYLPIQTPLAPRTKVYSNIEQENSGYVEMNWDRIPLANGYRVLVFNGKEYESFDVGSETSWTTQGKNIWPTAEEIKNGRFSLHHDGKGVELARDPSSVYKNAGTQYAQRKNYWFRVIAYQNTGRHQESANSAPGTPTIPASNLNQLGMIDYWTAIPVRGGEVNALNGNFIFHKDDFEIEGRGAHLGLTRTFNSQNTAVGVFGAGWSSTFEDKLVEVENGDLIWVESDMKSYRFIKKGVKYEGPPGIYSEITKEKDGAYLKVEQDKSSTSYNAQGNRNREEDKNGNKLEYIYDEDKLIKIVDASKREVTINYTNELITEITLPDQTKLTYKYNENKQLIESRSPRGKLYRYGYTNDLLTSVYDPLHKIDNPYETRYHYRNKQLIEVIDPVGKRTKLDYNSAKRLTTLTNERGKSTDYYYSLAGNPEKKVEDTTGLRLATTYTYQANNLIREVNPKGQTDTYKYDINGNIIEVTDEYGTETYEYNENNDVTAIVDTENQTTAIVYDEADPVSETISEVPTSSVSQYDQYGNVTRESQPLLAANNLLLNSSFESGDTANWYLSQNKNSGIIKTELTPSKNREFSGKYSAKVESKALSNDRGSTSAAQRIDVEPNTTYTLSADIKTEDMRNSQAFLDVWLIRADNRTSEGWRNNRRTAIKGNSDWVRRQVTFTTTANTHRIGVYLKNEQHANGKGSGTVWFNNVQLEEGAISSSYNPVTNSSFNNYQTNKRPDNWQVRGNQSAFSIVDNEGFSGDSSLKIARSQITDGEVVISQQVQLEQQQAKPFTVTAMSKSENVKHSANENVSSDYSMWIDIIYQDGSKSSEQALFPTGTNSWNRSGVAIIPTKPVKALVLKPTFYGEMTGSVWFDSVRIISGNILSEKKYDLTGNYVVEVIDEESRKTTKSYDVKGNVLTESDEKNQTKDYAYNEDNQLIKTTLANGTAVVYRYDDNGNATAKIVSAGNQTQHNHYTYDFDNKVTEFKDSLGRVITYEYDESGNQTETKMPKGHQIFNLYDSADRQSAVLWNEQPAFYFQYDPNGNETKVTDQINQVVKDKTYDDANRLTKVSERGGTVSYTFRDQPTATNKGKTDKIKDVTINQGITKKTTYEYNTLDQNTKVNDGSKNYLFEFDEFANKSLYMAGNGDATQYNHDRTQKIADITIGTAKGELILDERYRYDVTSNRTSITNIIDGETTYEYDLINQLTKEILPDKTTKRYQYDGFGNRTKLTITGSESKEIVATYNQGNQLMTWNGEELSYDANGNRLSDDHYLYQWDAGDRLISVTKKGEDKPVTTYQYDNDNRRINKKTAEQTINYHYDGDSINVLYETNEKGELLRDYVYSADNIRLAMRMNGKTLYYHYNGHGDVIALTDDTQQVVATYRYDAWGNVLETETKTTEAEANPYGYAGYTYDREIKMYYLMARYYQPEQGVFIAIDPDPGNEDDPITMNGYNYADNNPVMKIDPDGKVPWWVVSTVAGAAYRGGKYYLQNRKNFTWKTHGRKLAVETGKGAVRGLLKGTALRYTGLGSTGKVLGKVIRRGKYNPVRRAVQNIRGAKRIGRWNHTKRIFRTNKVIRYRK